MILKMIFIVKLISVRVDESGLGGGDNIYDRGSVNFDHNLLRNITWRVSRNCHTSIYIECNM